MVRDFKKNPISEEEIMHCYWHAVKDTTIGGWAVATIDKPTHQINPYDGEFELGTFLSESGAKHIADVHNRWYQDIVWQTYADNYLVTKHNDQYLYSVQQLIEDSEYDDAKYMATYIEGLDVTKLPYWPEHVTL